MKCEEKGILPDAPRSAAPGDRKGNRKFNAFAIMVLYPPGLPLHTLTIFQKRQGRTDADPRPEPGERVDPVKSFSILGQDLKITQEDGTWKLKDESTLQYVPGATLGFEAGEGDLKLGAIKVRHKICRMAEYSQVGVYV